MQEEEPKKGARRGLVRTVLGGVLSLTLFAAVFYWAHSLGKRDINQLPIIKRPKIDPYQTPPDSGKPVEALPQNRYSVFEDGQSAASEATTGSKDARLTSPELPNDILMRPDRRVTKPLLPVSVINDPAAEQQTNEIDKDLESIHRDVMPPPAISSASGILSTVTISAHAPKTSSPPVSRPSIPATTESINQQQRPTAPDPKSNWQVQLGAFASEADARTRWNDLVKKNPDILGALATEIPRALVNGKIYHRLRVGPLASQRHGRELCAQLKSRKIDCLVVKRR